jgi:ParB family transcriptional regulator, chromosome partitioning protein
MGREVIRLPLDQIEIAEQVRKDFSDESLQGMAQSLLAVGQLQPVIVQPFGGKYRLVAGERRVRSAPLAGLTAIAAIVDDSDLSPAEVIQRQLIENAQREDLTPWESAMGIKELMEETGWTAGETADKLGLSAATVSRLLALVRLPEAIQSKVRSGAISASAAYELGKIDDAAEQASIADQIAAGQMTRDAVSRAARRKKPPRAETDAKPSARIKAELSGGRSVTLAGAGLESLDTMIEWLEELLGRARKCRPKSLRTFLAILKDEARA